MVSTLTHTYITLTQFTRTYTQYILGDDEGESPDGKPPPDMRFGFGNIGDVILADVRFGNVTFSPAKRFIREIEIGIYKQARGEARGIEGKLPVVP